MAEFDEEPMNLKRPSQNNDEEGRISKRYRCAKKTETKNDCKTETKQEKNKAMFLKFLNLTSLINATETDEALIEFCKSYGLLPSSVVCRSCGKILEKHYVQKKRDKCVYRFQCPHKACRFAGRNIIYMRKNTFFEGAKISMRKSLVLTYQFISKATIEQSILETSGHVYNYELTSSETVVDFFSYCREVCVESLCNWHNSKMIGGKHFSVEVDVVQFGRRRNKACSLEDGQWMMGGYCRETNASFFVPLEDKEEKTILRIIEQRVEKKTTLITDCLACNTELHKMGYKFKDLRSVSCENFAGSNLQMYVFTRRIALNWYTLKRALIKSSTKQNQFVQYFAEYIWRKKHSNKFTVFTDFLHEIARVFPGPDY